VLRPIQTNRFASWPAPNFRRTFNETMRSFAREFSDTREQEMIAPRRLAIKIALAAFLIMCNPPEIFFADCDILKTNFSSGPLAPLVERRKDSVRRGLFRTIE
jgi:hypothetical protein